MVTVKLFPNVHSDRDTGTGVGAGQRAQCRLFLRSLLPFALVVGCQSSPDLIPQLPPDLQPIAGSITIGSRPVENAQQMTTKRMVVGDGAGQSRIVVTSRSEVDAVRSDARLAMRREILSIDVYLDAKAAKGRAVARRMQAMEGTVIEIDLDDATAAAEVRLIQNGAMTTYTGRAGARIAALITESHLGGRVVTQGKEVMRFALAEAIPRAGAGASDATFSGRVAGQAFHDGRQVIVVSVNGSVDVEGEPVRAVGAYLVDLLTGISLHGELTFSGLEVNGTEMDISISQRVQL